MILRLLNVQGIAGLAVSAILATLLLIQLGETRHWKQRSSKFELLYANEQAAFATTVAGYRSAAEQARAADAAAAARTRAQQEAINERTINDFEARVADARARADRLRVQAANAGAHPGDGSDAPMPGISTTPGAVAEGAGENRLPVADALTATEQAIQLDELIRWVQAQAKIDPNSDPPSQSR